MESHERRAERLAPIPEEIESPRAKLVYLWLEAADGATVDDLGTALAMKKIDILSVLNSLSSAGLVERDGDEYVVAATERQ